MFYQITITNLDLQHFAFLYLYSCSFMFLPTAADFFFFMITVIPLCFRPLQFLMFPTYVPLCYLHMFPMFSTLTLLPSCSLLNSSLFSSHSQLLFPPYIYSFYLTFFLLYKSCFPFLLPLRCSCYLLLPPTPSPRPSGTTSHLFIPIIYFCSLYLSFLLFSAPVFSILQSSCASHVLVPCTSVPCALAPTVLSLTLVPSLRVPRIPQ